VTREVELLREAHSLTRTNHASAHATGAVLDLVRDKSVRLLLVCCLVAHVAQQFCGINAVFYYSTVRFCLLLTR
jgi:phosphatidylglycerophosphate synthase